MEFSAEEKGKKAFEVGIAAKHGGEPRSVEFCHNVGMDYVSCSPFRVPIANLAAAQAALKKIRIIRDGSAQQSLLKHNELEEEQSMILRDIFLIMVML